MKVLASGVDSSLLMSNTGEDRPGGVHLSDILSRMAWDKDRKYNPEAPKDLMMFEQGHTWETVLARALAERHKDRAGSRIEPMQEDGIWLSPDWLMPPTKPSVPQHEEWKATRKSVAKIDEKVDEWGPQSKAYVRALLRRKMIRRPYTRFRIWFIMGDWSFGKGANIDLSLLRDYYCHDVEWTQRELDENWNAIISYARKHGMLEDEEEEKQPWHDRPSLNRTVEKRLERKAHGRTPPPSRAKARVATFPSGQRPRRSSSVS